ncbi:MAG: hypothetical protein E7287_08885 [Lachnospiraceae bacterium]|nr:hypothetical protein [Lachnospiraceae bacterium]
MIKKVAIVLLSSLLAVSSIRQTVKAAHGILWTYCPGDFVEMGEPILNSWSYTHTEDFDGVRATCYVHGRIERLRDYCFTCGKSQNIRCYQIEDHRNSIYTYHIIGNA